ncbi:hypothetical protein D3C80_1604830 [compost metagenome]
MQQLTERLPVGPALLDEWPHATQSAHLASPLRRIFDTTRPHHHEFADLFRISQAVLEGDRPTQRVADHHNLADTLLLQQLAQHFDMQGRGVMDVLRLVR